MNSLGNTNFRYAIYKLKLVGVACVDFCQKYFEKKILKKKNLWFSSKTEFLSVTYRFRSGLHRAPDQDEDGILAEKMDVHFRKSFSLKLYGPSTFADRSILCPIDNFKLDSLFAFRSLDPWSKPNPKFWNGN